MMSSKDVLYDRYGLALLELFGNIVIRSRNVHIMSVILTLYYYYEMTQRRKQTPTLLIKITQEFVILNLNYPIHYSSTNIIL